MTRQKQSSSIPVLAVLLACAIPGAGHVYLGRAKRGIIIFLTITALFWSGVGVGGVLTVDSQKERWWFVAQMLTGVNGLAAWQRQKRTYKALANVEGETIDDKAVKAGLGRIELVTPAETVARAYSGVAGLLNLMCIFDALMLSIMGARGEPQPKDDKPKPKSPVKKGAAT
jgi:TM2 domain-containing membrane protein YozV